MSSSFSLSPFSLFHFSRALSRPFHRCSFVGDLDGPHVEKAQPPANVPPEVSAGDELWCSSNWPPKVLHPVVVFVRFRCRPATFLGETTCFWTNIRPSTKPYPPCQLNPHSWKVGHYLHRAFHGLFWWTRSDSRGETPKKIVVLFISSCLIYIYIYWICFEDVQKTCFTRLNCQFECCLDLRVRLTRGRNWKSRPPLDSFWQHEHSGGLKFSKQASVTKRIFWESLLHRFTWKFDSWTSRTPF